MTLRRTATVALLLLAAGMPASADEIVARNLLISQGCKGCHSFEGGGGNLGPSLDRVGARLNAYQIERRLRQPKAANPDSIMPGYGHLRDEEIDALVDFLKKRK